MSRKTDFVLVDLGVSSKFDKVQKLGVKILDEAEFLKMAARLSVLAEQADEAKFGHLFPSISDSV